MDFHWILKFWPLGFLFWNILAFSYFPGFIWILLKLVYFFLQMWNHLTSYFKPFPCTNKLYKCLQKCYKVKYWTVNKHTEKNVLRKDSDWKPPKNHAVAVLRFSPWSCSYWLKSDFIVHVHNLKNSVWFNIFKRFSFEEDVYYLKTVWFEL